jgi:type VI secretion system protein ImpM
VPGTIVSLSAEPPGVYGKLPARGDFIARRLAKNTIDAWDAWLQQAIPMSRDTLAERWRDIYLTSPIWRFALSAGSCGPSTLIGVVVPSVDKVGRYFPLMLGRELPPGLELTGLIAQAASWYRAVESLALAALVPEFRLEEMEDPIALDIDATQAAPEARELLAAPGIQIPLGPGARGAALRHAYQPLARGQSLWWTSGSEHCAPCLLICPSLPPSQSFASLLDGDWKRGGWLAVAEEEAGEPAPAAAREADVAPETGGEGGLGESSPTDTHEADENRPDPHPEAPPQQAVADWTKMLD